MSEISVKFGDKEIRMRASALIPRLYRFRFKRDIINDMRQLQKDFNRVNAQNFKTEEEKEDAELSILDLTLFENIAWLFAWHADPEKVPDSPELWLDSIDGVFSVYEVLPQILELWADSQKQTSKPAKK